MLYTTWTYLKTADIGTFETPVAFHCLSKLPNLESLSFRGLALSAAWPDIDSTTPSALEEPFFPSLQMLDFHNSASVISLDSAIYIVRRLLPTNVLRLLSISASKHHESADRIQSLVNAITGQLSPSVFEDLWYSTSSYGSNRGQEELTIGSPSSSTLAHVDLSRLLPFHQLRRIHLRLQVAAILVPPEAALQIPEAWPNLKELILKSPRPTRPSVDREGLEAIFKGCDNVPYHKVRYNEDPDSDWDFDFTEDSDSGSVDGTPGVGVEGDESHDGHDDEGAQGDLEV